MGDGAFLDELLFLNSVPSSVDTWIALIGPGFWSWLVTWKNINRKHFKVVASGDLGLPEQCHLCLQTQDIFISEVPK